MHTSTFFIKFLLEQNDLTSIAINFFNINCALNIKARKKLLNIFVSRLANELSDL